MVRGGSFPFFWLRCMCACTQCAHQPLLELRRRQTPFFRFSCSPGGWGGWGRGRERPFKKRAKGSVGQVDPFSSVRAYAPISGVGKNGRGGWWVITGSPPAAETGLMQLLPHFSVSKGDRSFPLGASGEARGKCAHSYAL